jgi:hypothetical protein
MIFYFKISGFSNSAVKITLDFYILDKFLFFCKAFLAGMRNLSANYATILFCAHYDERKHRSNKI